MTDLGQDNNEVCDTSGLKDKLTYLEHYHKE